jgi:hypothetical protein
VRFLLNPYQFLAAGTRNRDINEHPLRDSKKRAVVRMSQMAEPTKY